MIRTADQILAEVADSGYDLVVTTSPRTPRASRKVRRDHPPCGTPGGYHVHLRNGELVCDACRAANKARRTAWRRRKGIGPRRPPECGTPAGEQLHRRRGEQPCQPCRDARNEYARAYREARRARRGE